MKLLPGILICVFDALLGIMFIHRFTKADVPKKPFKIIIYVAVAAAIFCLSPMYDPDANPGYVFGGYFLMQSPLRSALRLAVMYGFAFTCGKSKILPKIFGPIIFESLSVFINSIYSSYIFSNLMQSSIIVLTDSVFASVMLLVMIKVLTLSILNFFANVVNYEGRLKPLNITIYILSPLFTIFTMYLLMKVLFYRINSYNTEVIVAILGSTAINLFSFYLFNKTVKAEAENTRLQLYIKKDELERTRYSEMLLLHDEVSTVKHDLKNHLLCIKKYISDGKTDKIDDYIRTVDDMISCVNNPVVTGNSMLDYIISSKVRTPQSPTIVATGVLGELDSIDELDLAVLVGNLIDNAMEAAASVDSEEKLIEFDFSIFNGYQNITIKNDITSSVLGSNRELATTKADKKNHGFGMRSIRSIVEKYDGILEYYEEKGKFCIHIAFPITDELNIPTPKAI